MDTLTKLQNKINKLQNKLNNYHSYTKPALVKIVIELLSLEAQLERLQAQNATKHVVKFTFKKGFYTESHPDIYGKRHLIETDYQITTIEVTDNFVTSIVTLSNGKTWGKEYGLFPESDRENPFLDFDIEYDGYTVDVNCKDIYNLKYHFKNAKDWRQWSISVLSKDNLKTLGVQSV